MVVSLTKVTPPFKPQVTSDTDLQYFDVVFTSAPVELTPPDEESPLTAMEEDVDFVGFSYRDLSSTLGASHRSGPFHAS